MAWSFVNPLKRNTKKQTTNNKIHIIIQHICDLQIGGSPRGLNRSHVFKFLELSRLQVSAFHLWVPEYVFIRCVRGAWTQPVPMHCDPGAEELEDQIDAAEISTGAFVAPMAADVAGSGSGGGGCCSSRPARLANPRRDKR